jgi:UDP-N-acetylglucosamine 2-epimerase (non-hydrolysing)
MPRPIRPLIVLGTRPEAVKLAPLIQHCRARSDAFAPIVCSTGQHREMLRQTLGYFQITPEIDLDLMEPGQTLARLASKCITQVDAVLETHQPTCVVVQGDTTTVMATSIAAFFRHLPIVHVEAGLRTGDLQAPWPEEFNRRVAGVVARLHCAPTERSAQALLREGTPPTHVRVTGNTVIDALLWSIGRERDRSDEHRSRFPFLGDGRVVLITGHRRESFGDGLESTCAAIAELAQRHRDVQFIYPVHLNPNVQGPVHARLGAFPNVHLVPPADYPAFVWLMDRASVILTDSGGVQEEAPSLGKPVLVTRDKTERPEAIEAGVAELVGTDRETIVRRVSELLGDDRPREPKNPYGDGHAAQRIADWMIESWG